jgi:16S rRNA (guanine966-N2)-methyltransferase
LRIISGTHKGRRISAPKNLPVRPTTDRAKEGLFSALSHRVNFIEINVLDLFSGTGNLSYEFISRGTTRVDAVDAHRGACQFISKTSELLGFNITAICSDVFKFIARSNQPTYDLIVGDPPYDIGEDKYVELIDRLTTQPSLLNESGILILEHASNLSFDNHQSFEMKKKYGSSTFSWFEKKAGRKPDSV